MRKLLNTLFILSEDVYLSLDGENVVILRGKEELRRHPLHTLEDILCFSYSGASPALMGKCASMGIGLAFFSPRGKFLARTCGEIRGNVLLRKEQYRRSDNLERSCEIAQKFILGKVYNSKWVLERAIRDHALRIDSDRVKNASNQLSKSLQLILACNELDSLRGLEGETAARYFDVLDELILQNKEDFAMHSRTRRPPLDRFNALLSFIYTLLAHHCASALEGVGLDSYVGFLHRDRAGRRSLALDLMEELRPLLGDRLAITMVNNRKILPHHFDVRENGAVMLNDEGRKIVLTAWQDRKKESIKHPFLEENIQWGLVAYVQALLLARYLRGDIDDYPPFLWK